MIKRYIQSEQRPHPVSNLFSGRGRNLYINTLLKTRDRQLLHAVHCFLTGKKRKSLRSTSKVSIRLESSSFVLRKEEVASDWVTELVLLDELLHVELGSRGRLWHVYTPSLMFPHQDHVSMDVGSWLWSRRPVRHLMLTSIDALDDVAGRDVTHQPVQPFGDRRILPRQVVRIDHQQAEGALRIGSGQIEAWGVLQIPRRYGHSRLDLDTVPDQVKLLLRSIFNDARYQFGLGESGCDVGHSTSLYRAI